MNEVKLPALYRILDATTNRGREAIRVVEDVVRFVCNDSRITSVLKSVRHDFTELTNTFPRSERLRYRETTGDVGTTLTGKGEYLRQGLQEVLAANFSRFQESLRSLEEFTKMAWPDVATNIEQLRYLSYTLEKEIFVKLVDIERAGIRDRRLNDLARSFLCVVADTSLTEERFRDLVNVSVRMILLADRSASSRQILAQARRWRSVLNEKGAGAMEEPPLLLVAGHPEVAILAALDGILIQDTSDPPVTEMRTVLGAEMLVGCETNSSERATDLARDADFLFVGPVFSPTSSVLPETDRVQPPTAENEPVPLFATGGITTDRLPDLLAAGISRVAIGSAICDGDQPATTAAAIQDSLAALLAKNQQQEGASDE